MKTTFSFKHANAKKNRDVNIDGAISLSDGAEIFRKAFSIEKKNFSVLNRVSFILANIDAMNSQKEDYLYHLAANNSLTIFKDFEVIYRGFVWDFVGEYTNEMPAALASLKEGLGVAF
ncbi:hypothetical protein AVI51_15105 [Piscirickettsia salmonis]|uniref:Uncharacterized protein n=1 Tax=Piscirickettsia salmonis TaxID=1238 RepID=A0A9Q5VG23_PISSA|nr:hypothetical protein [Piscirickettsia salmonis]ALA24359.1 hypothetical protein KW89_891 [Piscirickettsia salmonis]APS44731.1 hypothetical protein AVI48_10390 [Piscirickettsia salmonis]APS48091.1 hypothetical protein AVI49_10995 [Piscirickettsia salmonis]APS52047.1 hypothetical protein AVI50_15260 [Piscirickettsia salmonis]APS55265.1 hypothetical protein AVI51_15105 [Piscirickettsia salmonis]